MPGSLLARDGFDHTMAVCGRVGRWGLRVFRGRSASLDVMATPLELAAITRCQAVGTGESCKTLPGILSHPCTANTPEGLPPCDSCRSILVFQAHLPAAQNHPDIQITGGFRFSS